MDRSTELLGRRRIRIEGAQIRVVRPIAIGTPVTQEFTGVRVHDDDSLVSVSVPDEGLVAVLVEGDLRHLREVRPAVGVNSLSGFPHLHQETAVPRELENVGIALAVPADPDVVHGVHLKAVIRCWPGVLAARPTEGIHQIPLHIELQHVGSPFTTHGVRLIWPHVSLVPRIQRVPAVDDEDVVTRIDAHTNHVAQNPVVRKRFGHAGVENHVIVAGYGRAARQFAGVLLAARTPHVIITLSPRHADEAELDGRIVVRGDATRQSALRHARVTRAKMLFIPDEDAGFAHRVARVARTLNPTLRIVTRARFESTAEAMVEAGTDQIVTEELETVVQLFGEVLRDYHIEPAEVEHFLGVIRNERYHVLHDTSRGGVLAPIGDMIAGALDTRTVTLRNGAPVIGETLEEIGFEEKGLSVKSLHRGHSLVTMPPSHLALKEADIVTLAGTAAAFAESADLFRTGTGETIQALVPETPTEPEERGPPRPVQLYGADWCPLTGVFRGYLKQQRVPFEYHDVETDPRAEQAVRAMNGGEVKFPMVVGGDYAMKNPPIDELEGALRASGILSA